MEDFTYTKTLDHMVVRIRPPVSPGSPKLIVMLHGWMGDENVMWIFASRLPGNCWIVAPRGIYQAPGSGYGWHPLSSAIWPQVSSFQPAIFALRTLFESEYINNLGINSLNSGDIGRLPIHLLGFSQGAALAFTLALRHRDMILSAAGLSGFLPEDYKDHSTDKPLSGLPVFMAHGTRDEIVPVERARSAVEILGLAGAVVDYCENAVGHKLSAPCFRSLEAFFHDQMLSA